MNFIKKLGLLSLSAIISFSAILGIINNNNNSSLEVKAEETYYYVEAKDIAEVINAKVTSRRFYLVSEDNITITSITSNIAGSACRFENAQKKTKNGRSYITKTVLSPYYAIYFPSISLGDISVDVSLTDTFAWKYDQTYAYGANGLSVGDVPGRRITFQSQISGSALSRCAFEIKKSDNSRFHAMSESNYPLRRCSGDGNINNVYFTNGWNDYFHIYYETNLITVNLDKQGGSDGSDTTSAFADLAFDPIEIPARTGYTCGGYNSSPVGGGYKYISETGISLLNCPDSLKTLYAKWTPNDYEINFDNIGGRGETSIGVTYDADVSKVSAPIKDGYDFDGYYDNLRGEGTKYFDDEGNYLLDEGKYKLANDLNLFANWISRKDDAKSKIQDVLALGLDEDLVTLSNISYTESVEDASHKLKESNMRYFDRPNQYIYRLTGVGNCTNNVPRVINFAKPSEEETTFYIYLDNVTYMSNNWSWGLDLKNQVEVIESDEVIKITDSLTPIHWVFIVEGENIISGHNHGAISFLSPNALQTVQFMTIHGGSLTQVVAYHQEYWSNLSDIVVEDELIECDVNTSFSKIELGKINGNLSSYNENTLREKIADASILKTFENSNNGLFSAYKTQYDTRYEGCPDFYSIMNVTFEHVHEYNKHDLVPSTCTDDGVEEYYSCDICGKVFQKDDTGQYIEVSPEDLVIEKHGHNYVGVVTVMATDEQPGLILYTCSYCQDQYTEVIPQLPKINPGQDLSPEEEKQYEAAVEKMTNVLPNVIEEMDMPDPSVLTPEEYAREMEKYIEKQEQIAKIDDSLDIIRKVNTSEPSSIGLTPEEKKQTQENVVVITETVTKEKNDLDAQELIFEQILKELEESGSATQEQIQEVKDKIKLFEDKKEIVEIVTTQAVVVTAKQTMCNDIADSYNLKDVPSDASLGNLAETFFDFMQIQIHDLTTKTKTSKSLFQASSMDEEHGIEYGLKDTLEETKLVYKQVEVCVDTTIDNASKMANKVRNCSQVESKKEIKAYIEKITVESFRDFDKEAADAEFVENAYMAVLRNMQSQVLTSLEQSKPTGNYELQQKWEEEYKAVSDIEEFEIIVFEVMRRKYNSISDTKYDDVESFAPIYKEIFRKWVLNIEDGSGITLEQLTKATVEEEVNKVSHPIIFTSLGSNELAAVLIIAFSSIGVIALAIIIPVVIKRKKKGGLNDVR